MVYIYKLALRYRSVRNDIISNWQETNYSLPLNKRQKSWVCNSENFISFKIVSYRIRFCYCYTKDTPNKNKNFELDPIAKSRKTLSRKQLVLFESISTRNVSRENFVVIRENRNKHAFEQIRWSMINSDHGSTEWK